MQTAERIIRIQNDATAAAYALEEPSVALKDGGSEGWKLRPLQYGGMQVSIFEADPAAQYPVHSTAGTYVGVVIRGEGILVLADSAHRIQKEIPFRMGDILVFEPDTPHGWKAGERGVEIAFFNREQA